MGNNININFSGILKIIDIYAKKALIPEFKKIAVNKINLINAFPLEKVARIAIFFSF